MATLPEQFKKALSNIEPDSADVANAAAAHAEVRKVLQADSLLKGWGIDPILIGSYSREVSIRRVKDVDVFGRLTDPPADLRPGRVLDEFDRVLTAKYGSRVEPQHRSFKVDFLAYGLSVDAVPARPSGDHWEIPSRPDARGRWVPTNPTRLGELTSQMNSDYRFGKIGSQGAYVPTVKMIRQIRRNLLQKAPPGGLYLEICLYWVFERDMSSQTTWAGYLTKALEGLPKVLRDAANNGLEDPTLPDSIISTRATNAELRTAADAFAGAAELADDAIRDPDECEAAAKWGELFGANDDGTVFEPPAHCASRGAGQASSVRVRTPGAVRPPAGDGRYA